MLDSLADLKRRLRDGEYVDGHWAASVIELLEAGCPLDVGSVLMVRQSTEQTVCVVLENGAAAQKFLRQLSGLAQAANA